MSDNTSYTPKLSRSRSLRLKPQSDYGVINLHRSGPISVPKSIIFTRGTNPRAKSMYLDSNSWISLPDRLSRLISQENTLVSDYNTLHTIPTDPTNSVFAFLRGFELESYDPTNPILSDGVKSFCQSIETIFAQIVGSKLLYEPELNSATKDVLLANPVHNAPAIYLIRFLYYFPKMMQNSDPDSEVAQNLQANLRKLMEYGEGPGNHFFVLPSVRPQISPANGTKLVMHIGARKTTE